MPPAELASQPDRDRRMGQSPWLPEGNIGDGSGGPAAAGTSCPWAHTASKQTNLSKTSFSVNSPLQARGLRGPSQNGPTPCPLEPGAPCELSCKSQSQVVREPGEAGVGGGSQAALHGAPWGRWLTVVCLETLGPGQEAALQNLTLAGEWRPAQVWIQTDGLIRQDCLASGPGGLQGQSSLDQVRSGEGKCCLSKQVLVEQ